MTAERQHDADLLELPLAEVRDRVPGFASAEDFQRAAQLGAFLVRVPDGIDLSPGLRLCRSYHLPAGTADDRYRGHRSNTHALSKLGYEDRPDQVEQLQLESALWDVYLPEEVTAMLRAMKQLAMSTLQATFDFIGVPAEDRPVITGAASGEGTAWCHTTVNHYRSSLSGRSGIFDHTDSGFITLIYADGPGLEIFDSRWRPAQYRSDCFTVNFGATIGVLTEHLVRPVTAVLHRVPELPDLGADRERSSFTVFLGPSYDQDVMQYDEDGNLSAFQNFRDFSVKQAEKQRYEFHARL